MNLKHSLSMVALALTVLSAGCGGDGLDLQSLEGKTAEKTAAKTSTAPGATNEPSKDPSTDKPAGDPNSKPDGTKPGDPSNTGSGDLICKAQVVNGKEECKVCIDPASGKIVVDTCGQNGGTTTPTPKDDGTNSGPTKPGDPNAGTGGANDGDMWSCKVYEANGAVCKMCVELSSGKTVYDGCADNTPGDPAGGNGGPTKPPGDGTGGAPGPNDGQESCSVKDLNGQLCKVCVDASGMVTYDGCKQ
jgi:hypothetical protein